MNAQQVWATVLRELQLRLPRSDFETWLQGTSIVGFEDGLVIVGTPNSFAKQWLNQHARDLLRRALGNVLGYVVQLRLVVAEGEPAAPRPLPNDPGDAPAQLARHDPPLLLGRDKEERSIVFRKGKWIDFPFEPFWNSYDLYISNRVLVKAPLLLGDVAAHLWFCARYHQEHPHYSTYTRPEIAAVLYGDEGKQSTVRGMLERLQAVSLLDVEYSRGRGARLRVRPYLPLTWDDFLQAAADGFFPGCALREDLRQQLRQVKGPFDRAEFSRLYPLEKPHNFQREKLQGRGWEPCLHTLFDLYVGNLLRVREEGGASFVPIPGVKEELEIPWTGAPAGDWAVARLTRAPLLHLEAITLALLLRKWASISELTEKDPYIQVSLRRIKQRFNCGWASLNEALTQLERAGIAREIGDRRAQDGANIAARFALWDPCETAWDFFNELQQGRIRLSEENPEEKLYTHALLTEFGLAVATRLGIPLEP